jgi:hypothetical protein
MNTRRIKIFIGTTTLSAAAFAIYAGLASHALHLLNALLLLVLAAATSRMKVKLPRVEGNMSMNLPFLLMAVVSLSALEAVMIASISTIVQCWPKRDQTLRSEQILFNVSMMAVATSVSSLIWNAGWLGKTAWASEPLMLASSTAAFFLGQTAPVAGIIKLTQGMAIKRIWLSIAQLSFPYFVVSAGMTSMVNAVSHHLGWQLALAVFPVMYGIYHSYRIYFGKAEVTRIEPMRRAAGVGV